MRTIDRRWYAVVMLSIAACVIDEDTTSNGEQAGKVTQGVELQGLRLQGLRLQGLRLQGFTLGSVRITGQNISNARVERGELVADRGTQTLHGDQLVGAHLEARGQSETDPQQVVEVEYQITAVVPESAANDPTHTGNTYLYTLRQWVEEDQDWELACPPDADGKRVAIPLTATWNDHGDRIESPGMFTFGCTSGVIAKCYRWGYRPWITGYNANMPDMHWTCTRMARGDYCGTGVPHTHENTAINLWDRIPPPGPIQKPAFILLPPMLFEAGWDTHGAVCLSTARWNKISYLLDQEILAGGCGLIRPTLPIVGGTVCDTLGAVLGLYPQAKLYNQSYINDLDL